MVARIRVDENEEGPTTITVSIEIVLAEIPPIASPETSDGIDDENPEATEATNEELSLPKTKYLLPLPFFRFRFIEGSCVETPTVLDAEGATSESWAEVVPDLPTGGETRDQEKEDDETATIAQSEESQQKQEGSGEGSNEATIKQPSPPPPPKRFIWSQEFPIEKVDDAFLIALNERPHFVTTLCCKETKEGGEDATSVRVQAPTNTGSLLGFLPMDVSSLLDGDTTITRRCCALERGAGNTPNGLLEWKIQVSIPEPMLTKHQRLRLNPLSVHFHRIVRLPGIDIEETRNPRMLKCMLPTRFALLREHCHPIFTLFQLQMKRSPDAIEHMKTLQQQEDSENSENSDETAKNATSKVEDKYLTTFQRVVSTLPIAQEIESELAGPTEEELKAMEKAKKKRARQKGKSKKGKKGKEPSSEGADLPERDRRRRDVSFDHKTVILAGLLDRVSLLDYLSKGSLQFELHDRDVVDHVVQNSIIAEHERMITGDPNPTDVQAAMKRAVSILSAEQRDDPAAVTTAQSSALNAVPRSEPNDPYDVVDQWWSKRTKEMITAADVNTHGIARVTLSQLASYTGELRAGFQKERSKEKWMTKTEKIRHLRAQKLADSSNDKKKKKGLQPDIDDIVDGESLKTGQEIKMREVVRPTKRRTAVTDDEEQESWDYTEEQRLVRNPGAYLLSGTEVVVSASIARNPMSVVERKRRTSPVIVGTEADRDTREGDFEATRSGANGVDGLTEAGVRAAKSSTMHFTDVCQGAGRSNDRIFERAVYCFRYDDEDILREIQGAMYEVNQNALEEASLRSHQLTKEERFRADSGDLDVITGFTIIDDAYRLVIVEGLGAKGMQTMHRRVKRKVQNGPRTRVLSDPTVTFSERLYSVFDLDLKRIRLRDELPRICESPDIYNRAKVPLEVFEALHRLFRVRTSMRLRHVRDNQLFPTSFMLLRLESKYGEAISLVDMDGQSLIMDPNATLADDDSEEDDDDEEILDPRVAREQEDAAAAGIAGAEETKKKKKQTKKMVDFDAVPEIPKKRKADTDCWNDKFEQFLLEEENRAHPDYIGENERLAKTIKQQVLEHRASLPPVDANLPPEVNGNIFIYSGQKLQLTELRREQMKKRLSKRKNITFTYSSEFQSQTLCLVNEDDIDKDAKELSKSKMTTKGGFVYPAPKDPEEYKKHPRQLSQSRRDQLKEPWEEPGTANIDDAPKPWELPGSVDFDTIPDLKPKLFGGYRTDGTQEIDEVFFRSVHMGGDGVEQEMFEAMKKKKQEWLDAVIVDNIHYQPHYGERGDKPSQLGKLDDILSRPPQKLGLKVVHRAKLPSGKRILFRAPPASMMANSFFEDPKDFTEGMRPDDPAHYFGTDAGGQKVNFITKIHKDMMKPPMQRLLYTRKVEQLTEKEKSSNLFTGKDTGYK